MKRIILTAIIIIATSVTAHANKWSYEDGTPYGQFPTVPVIVTNLYATSFDAYVIDAIDKMQDDVLECSIQATKDSKTEIAAALAVKACERDALEAL